MRHGYHQPPVSIAQLHALRVFSTVAEMGSITRAANQLFRAPSAVTRSMLELERALGASLFERHARGLLLTAAGDIALVRARRLETEIASATADLAHLGVMNASSASGLSAVLASGRKLQLVSELAALSSISGAARQLGISPAGASMALGRIEAMIGLSLFQRRPDGMAPTEVAERLALHASRAFAEMRHLEGDLADLLGRTGGAVVVGTTPLGRTMVFTSAIVEASLRHPEISVVTIEGDYATLADGLLHGEIDLAVGVPRDAATGLETEHLFNDQLGIMLRGEHPLLGRASPPRLEELLEEQWILPPSSVLGRTFIEGCFRELGYAPPRPTIESGDPAIIRQILTTTNLVAVVSPALLITEIANGTVVQLPITLSGAVREIGLIVREGALLSAAAPAVAAAIREKARERAAIA